MTLVNNAELEIQILEYKIALTQSEALLSWHNDEDGGGNIARRVGVQFGHLAGLAV